MPQRRKPSRVSSHYDEDSDDDYGENKSPKLSLRSARDQFY
jgi:hypothetical protein